MEESGGCGGRGRELVVGTRLVRAWHSSHFLVYIIFKFGSLSFRAVQPIDPGLNVTLSGVRSPKPVPDRVSPLQIWPWLIQLFVLSFLSFISLSLQFFNLLMEAFVGILAPFPQRWRHCCWHCDMEVFLYKDWLTMTWNLTVTNRDLAPTLYARQHREEVQEGLDFGEPTFRVRGWWNFV